MISKSVILMFVLVIVIGFLGSVSALSANIGNSRMILRAEAGEEIERYILVQNKNDVSVMIELTKAGVISEDIEILDNNFTLLPGEERRANFILEAVKSGDARINVAFTPLSGGGGVGLASTIILAVEGEDVGDSDTGNGSGDSDSGNGDVGDSDTGNGDLDSGNDWERPSFSSILIGFSVLLLVVFIVLVFFAQKRAGKKSSKKGVKEAHDL